MKNISDKIILCFFIFLLLIPLITFNFDQYKFSANELRYLEPFPTFFDSNGNFSSTFREDFNNWFKDNIGFRDAFIKICANIEYTLFKRTFNSEITTGSNGWLYLNNNSNIEIVKETYPNFEEYNLQKICEKQIKLKNYLAQQGIEYVLILTPSKISIYPEHVFNGFYTPNKTPVDILADYLEEHSDIKIINTKKALLAKKNKSNALLYSKTDTHWNWHGIKIGYLELIKKLTEWDIISTPSLNLKIHKTGYFIGDLARMNYINILDPEYSFDTKNFIPTPHYHEDETSFSSINNLVNGPTILSYGDSMSTSLMFLFSANVPKLSYINSTEIDQNTIDTIKPDVLTYQRGERFLSDLQDLNEALYTNYNWNKQNNYVDISYFDDTKYKELYVNIWPTEDFEKGIALYSTRYNDNTWIATLDLNKFPNVEHFTAHFYGITQNNTEEFIMGIDYYFSK